MKYILIFVFAFLQCVSTAQPADSGIEDVNNNLFEPNFRVRPKGYPAKLDGSGMLFKKGVIGYLVLKDKTKTKEVEVNYNLLVEETVINSDKGKYSIKSEFIDSLICVVNNKITKYVYTNVAGDNQIRIWEVLIDGNFPLYKTKKTKLVRPYYNPVLQTGNKNFTVKNDMVYATKNKNNYVELPRNARKVRRKQIYDVEFKKLVKRENPTFRSEEGLISFFKVINSN